MALAISASSVAHCDTVGVARCGVALEQLQAGGCEPGGLGRVALGSPSTAASRQRTRPSCRSSVPRGRRSSSASANADAAAVELARGEQDLAEQAQARRQESGRVGGAAPERHSALGEFADLRLGGPAGRDQSPHLFVQGIGLDGARRRREGRDLVLRGGLGLGNDHGGLQRVVLGGSFRHRTAHQACREE